ncbi:MAG: hypothetical protein DSY89_00260 [Deltaproteobacteria bacterium]|nr:MAG: hypothetical protein DSY89_00260 [Deltaproteobacteria bacterium]
MKNRDMYQRARKRVKKRLGFYLHLAIYVTVNFLLIATNLSTTADCFWAKWPLMGWGIGLFFHGAGVFLFSEKSHIIQKMIENEMEKDI